MYKSILSSFLCWSLNRRLTWSKFPFSFLLKPISKSCCKLLWHSRDLKLQNNQYATGSTPPLFFLSSSTVTEYSPNAGSDSLLKLSVAASWSLLNLKPLGSEQDTPVSNKLAIRARKWLSRSWSWALCKGKGCQKAQGEQPWGELPWRWGALCLLTSWVPQHHPAFPPEPYDFLTASAQHKTCGVSAIQVIRTNRTPGK